MIAYDGGVDCQNRPVNVDEFSHIRSDSIEKLKYLSRWALTNQQNAAGILHVVRLRTLWRESWRVHSMTERIMPTISR